MAEVPIKRALLSVWDKEGLVEFARELVALGVELISTGGTARALTQAGLAVVEVADLTGAPEILDGRVKTLHPRVHGGLLARRDQPAHMATLAEHQIAPIDLLVSNLYPFEQAVAADAGDDDTVEMIDIGGPAMIRAAAKNHESVALIVEPGDYPLLLGALRATQGGTTLALRRRLAAKAFARTAAYDAAIAAWFTRQQGELLPERLVLAGTRAEITRYGENPHQRAAFYRTGDPRPGIASARQLQGKELSYNNLADADAAFELVAEFDRPAVAIIKHANPCGVAVAGDLAGAYAKALACDRLSAFGGIVAVNRTLDASIAEQITSVFTEVVIAPDASDDARSVLAARKNLRLLLTGGVPEPRGGELVARSVAGGFLVQERDVAGVADLEIKAVTERAPSAAERADLEFAFAVAKHVKSNAIVFAKDEATIGIGAGQMSRIDSVRIAVAKAQAAVADGAASLVGSVVASDAFFPFADGLEAALAAGATAAIQPGGSLRDQEVIAAADRVDAAMVVTGRRHFRH